MRQIVIGDIHGCFYSFIDLLNKVKYNSTTDQLILLGDYIDRGPHSCKVVDALVQLQSKHGKDRCVCLCGNHEKMLLEEDGDPTYLWLYNGGNQTILSYENDGRVITNHLNWYKTLPLFYQTDRFIFCHAGLTYPDLHSNKENDFLWGRSWLEIDRRKREKTVVFGHTPMENVPYIAMTGDIGIDGGCVFGGSLCAMIIPESKDYYFESVVKSPKDCI